MDVGIFLWFVETDGVHDGMAVGGGGGILCFLFLPFANMENGISWTTTPLPGPLGKPGKEGGWIYLGLR